MRTLDSNLDSFGLNAMMRLIAEEEPETLHVFENADGEILILTDMLHGDILISRDGKTFQKVRKTGYAGSSPKFHQNYEDPVRGVYGHLFFEGGIITRFEVIGINDAPIECGTYSHFTAMASKLKITQGMVFLPLPDKRRAEYLFRLSDGSFIFVDASEYSFSYVTLRFFMGKPQAMVQYPITKFARAYYGGTAYLSTSLGDLMSPRPTNVDSDSTWTVNGVVQKLEKLDVTLPQNIALMKSFQLIMK